MQAVKLKTGRTDLPSRLRLLCSCRTMGNGPKLPLLLVEEHSTEIFNAAGNNEMARTLTSKGRFVQMDMFGFTSYGIYLLTDL